MTSFGIGGWVTSTCHVQAKLQTQSTGTLNSSSLVLRGDSCAYLAPKIIAYLGGWKWSPRCRKQVWEDVPFWEAFREWEENSPPLLILPGSNPRLNNIGHRGYIGE